MKIKDELEKSFSHWDWKKNDTWYPSIQLARILWMVLQKVLNTIKTCVSGFRNTQNHCSEEYANSLRTYKLTRNSMRFLKLLSQKSAELISNLEIFKKAIVM